MHACLHFFTSTGILWIFPYNINWYWSFRDKITAFTKNKKLTKKQSVNSPPVCSIPRKVKEITVQSITTFLFPGFCVREDVPPILNNECGWCNGFTGEHTSPYKRKKKKQFRWYKNSYYTTVPLIACSNKTLNTPKQKHYGWNRVLVICSN